MAKICAYSWILIFMTVNEMNCVLGHLKGQPCSSGRIWHKTDEGSYVCCTFINGQVDSGKPDGLFITAIVLPISLSAAGAITIMVITKLCIRKNVNGGVVV